MSRGRRRAWYWRARLPWQRDPFAVHSVHHSRLAQCKINVSRAREVCVMLVLNKSNIRKAYRDKYLMFLQLNSFASALIFSLLFPHTCTFNNGGCSHACTSLRYWKVQCSCPVDMQLMGDGKTCQSGELLTAIQSKS